MKKIMPVYEEYVIVLSFANYLISGGGTDKVIKEHQNIFNQNRISFIEISPAISTKISFQSNAYAIVVDGTFFNVTDEPALFGYLREIQKNGYYLNTIFVHHIKQFSFAFLDRFLYFANAPIIFYLHDYYMICKQINMLKAQVFCGEGAVSDSKCNGCDFYDRKHLDSVKKLLEKYKNCSRFVSPSDITRRIWINTHPEFSERTMVIKHQTLMGENTKKPFLSVQQKMKIAYLGRMDDMKGGEIWRKITSEIKEKNLPYKLYYLGSSEYTEEGVCKIPVLVTSKNSNAMINALRKQEIHLVVLWSLCPETYSYTCFEAFAANCFILTYKNSGNIADMVRENKNGIVFDNESQVLAFLQDPQKVYDRLSTFLSMQNAGPEKLLPNTEILNLLQDKHNSYRKIQIPPVHLSVKIKIKLYNLFYRWKYRKRLRGRVSND